MQKRGAELIMKLLKKPSRESANKENGRFNMIFSKSGKFIKSLPGKLGFHRIRNKLIMAFAVLIVPTILLGIISYTTSANSIKSIAMSTTEDTMMHASKYLGLLFKNIDSLCMQIYTDQNMQDYLSNKNGQITKRDYEYVKILNDASSAFSRHTFSTKDVSNVVIGNESKYFQKIRRKYDFVTKM